MSSNPNPPSRDNGYLLPIRQWFNRQFLQPILTSIHERLLPLEAQVVNYEEATNLILTQALETVTATLTQEITNQRQILGEIQRQAEEILDEYQSRNISANRVLLDEIPGLAAATAQAAIQRIVSDYVRKDGSSGIVQIGTTNGNNGGLRLARRTSGFTSQVEFLDGEGAVAGLFGRSEGGGIPFILFRVAGNVTDTIRFFADNIQILVGGAYRAVWHTGTAPEATDAEADAGTVGAARMWSPARLWRAVRAALPLVSQSVAEAGTDTVARSWSVLRVWQAIRAALPLPSTAEIDAGTATDPRSISASLLFRAARAALPPTTQAIAEAGTDTVDRSWSAVRIWQAIRAAIPTATDAEISAGTVTTPRALTMTGLWRGVRAVIANDKEIAVDFYGGARLDGQSSIVLDMPAGFNKYRIEFGGLRLRSGTSLMTLRNGPSGGALNAGEGAYQDVTVQRRGEFTDEANNANNAFVIAGLSTGSDQYGEIIVHDQPGQFWAAHALYVGIDAGDRTIVSTRGSRYAPGANPAGGRWGRIGLLFGGQLANAGYVRVYGVRTS